MVSKPKRVCLENQLALLAPLLLSRQRRQIPEGGSAKIQALVETINLKKIGQWMSEDIWRPFFQTRKQWPGHQIRKCNSDANRNRHQGNSLNYDARIVESID